MNNKRLDVWEKTQAEYSNGLPGNLYLEAIKEYTDEDPDQAKENAHVSSDCQFLFVFERENWYRYNFRVNSLSNSSNNHPQQIIYFHGISVWVTVSIFNIKITRMISSFLLDPKFLCSNWAKMRKGKPLQMVL